MKTLFGAVAGALTLGAVLVSYNLGESHTFSRDAAMAAAYQQQMMNPYLTPVSQTGYAYGAPFAAQTPYGVTPVGYAMPQAVPQYASQRVLAPQPAARRTVSQRTYSSEQVSKPARTWQKSALLIGGSAAGGAGVGALIGGKKGAGIGALLGGGSAAIYDQVKRH
jgi:hypothetical protein